MHATQESFSKHKNWLSHYIYQYNDIQAVAHFHAVLYPIIKSIQGQCFDFKIFSQKKRKKLQFWHKLQLFGQKNDNNIGFEEKR
jgi:hypothetical protein